MPTKDVLLEIAVAAPPCDFATPHHPPDTQAKRIMSAEGMEVFLKDSLTGEQHAVHIGPPQASQGKGKGGSKGSFYARQGRGQLSRLKATALDVVLGSPPDTRPEDVELSVDGEVLDDSTPLCDVARVSQGCSIDVALTGARFLERFEEEREVRQRTPWNAEYLRAANLPAWALLVPQVALEVEELERTYYMED